MISSSYPREQLLRYGSDSLNLSQSVALILGSGTAHMPVTVLSVRVSQALQTGMRTVAELCSLPGLGPAKAAAVVGALHLYPLLHAPALPDLLANPEAVYQACADLLCEPQEHVVTFFLSVRQRSVRRELISVGTATTSVLHAREVFRAAIQANAHSLILAHNHPSGDPHPSTADLHVTKQLARAGETVGIELLDHVICARAGWYSLREHAPTLFQ